MTERPLQGWVVIWEEGDIPRMTSNLADEQLAKEYAELVVRQDERRSIVAVCDANDLRTLVKL